MRVLGIDPGLGGALALYDPDAAALDLPVLDIRDMPVGTVRTSTRKTRGEIDEPQLADIVRDLAPDLAVLELVGAAPKQGVVSMFRFGVSVGAVRGVLGALRVPLHVITPQEWRRVARVKPGKDASRLRASQLFPAHAGLFGRAMDHGRADAALMAYSFVISR